MRREMAISPIHENDVEALHRLHAGSFWQGWDEEAFQSFLQDSSVFGFAARPIGQPENIVGFVLARLVADEGEILSIAVDPSRRRDGVGHALMRALMRHLHHQRAEMLFLEVDETNQAARALYQRYGFEEVGRRPSYYKSENGCSDALVLKRQFRSGS